jgi:uncharacterized protein YutE (UPF0331/DUF86 family)
MKMLKAAQSGEVVTMTADDGEDDDDDDDNSKKMSEEGIFTKQEIVFMRKTRKFF